MTLQLQGCDPYFPEPKYAKKQKTKKQTAPDKNMHNNYAYLK